jgi:hypothetical protein
MATQLTDNVLRPVRASLALACIFGLGLNFGSSGEVPKAPYKVQVKDEKAVVVEAAAAEGPVDPVARIRYQPPGNMYMNIQGERGETLHLSHFPSLNVDGRFIQVAQGQIRMEVANGKLPKTPGGKERQGYMNVGVVDDIRITQSLEVVATKAPAPGQKRLRDALLIRHTIENKGKVAHKVGLRIYMDTYIVDNDGCLFAAPTHPGKVLNGIELKEKTLPEYVQLLQRPDLKTPGYVAHLTLGLGSSVEKANRVVLTHHGNGFNSWDMPPNPSQGDSALGIFWDVKEIKPGGKRETAYIYGKGVGIPPGSSGRFSLTLGGSMQPGKLFTIAAQVLDPAVGQTMTLDLPKGMKLIEGHTVEPVPGPLGDRAESLVLWKARVLEPGTFQLRVRSSTGMTQAKTITIAK